MGEIRSFASGATRNSDAGKNDYEGFISPAVLRAYGDYMTENRVMADGSVRDSDNWQKGIPREQYVKSFVRHSIDFWLLWRGWPVKPDVRNGVEIPWTYERLACAVMFNIMGFLNETLKGDTFVWERVQPISSEKVQKMLDSMCDEDGHYVGYVPQNKMGKGYLKED